VELLVLLSALKLEDHLLSAARDSYSVAYIYSYPPYLGAFSSIRNPTTLHAVVTGKPLNVEIQYNKIQN
jgi:hypothetical protein